MEARKNDYERLALGAAELCFCTNMGCTTCGCMEIRNGLELIGMGKLPATIHHEGEFTKGHLWNPCPAHDLLLAREAATADLAYLGQQIGSYLIQFAGFLLERFECGQIRDREAAIAVKSTGIDPRMVREVCWRLISVSWVSQLLRLAGASTNEGTVAHLQDLALGRKLLGVNDLWRLGFSAVFAPATRRAQ